MPSSASCFIERLLSSSRSTAVSPQIVAPVATRTSTPAPSIVHLELAVLRTPPLDDVHVGHDLDAADQLGPGRRGKLEHLAQRAVDAEADPHPPFGRLDVDVGRAVAQRLGDDLVDELDDRRVVGGADDGLDLLLGRGTSPRTA